MDNRTGADRDSSTKLPTGQTSRGYSDTTSRNPKSNSSRRPDVVGRAAGDGGAVNQQTTKTQSPAGYPSGDAKNRFGKGSGSTEPNPANVNRGYTEVTDGNVPRISRTTSANRQNYGIDPGEPPQPQGDDMNGPRVPKYGVGTTGE